MKSRYLSSFIRRDLKRKMVFVGGPRQAGKTTLALNLLGITENDPAYYNYDSEDDRERLFAGKWPKNRVVILDEVHKYLRWKGWLKGVYDKSKSFRNYLVTGSARMDLYRRGGDSLMGRYHYYRLHPFSVSEIVKECLPFSISRLLRLGGFPEPYLSNSAESARRWRRERRSNIIRQDVRDLELIRDLTHMELLASRLPHTVGSPLSVNALREDLQVTHKTAAKWLDVLERFYFCFRVYPFGSDKIRAVKKEPKLYLWDWGEVEDEGARFENMVASHLLKYCHFIEDTQGYDMELRYLRDRDGREIDFVVVRGSEPLFAVECKLNESRIPRAFSYFSARTKVPKFYLVHGGKERFFDTDPVFESVGAVEFLSKFV